MEAQAEATVSWWAVTLSITVGYLAACIVGASVFVLSLAIDKLIGGRDFIVNTMWDFVADLFWESISLSMMMLLLCLPAFLILRLFLKLARRRDLFSFALAGVFLPVISAGYFFGFADGATIGLLFFSILAFAGASAGAMAWLTERWLSNRCLTKLADKSRILKMEA